MTSAIAEVLDVPVAVPFSAIVGQDEMKRAILIAAVDARLGGVLVFDDRGTGKSTAVRALAVLLPRMSAAVGCPYGCPVMRSPLLNVAVQH
jgi:magnesium chelatase subunit I